MLDNKVILVTGGTGSFGQKFTEIVFKRYKPKKLIIFSRDEYKQSKMAKIFPTSEYPIRYFLGDIRDRYRLYRAFEGVDYIVHAAALKQVPALEYNPTEAVKTNVVGADNIVDTAIDTGVKKVIAVSTDKAVNPINLYGATKLVAEKIFIAANAYAGGTVKFSVVRYGNVVGSRGSVIPLFEKQKSTGTITITDKRMTRFWITLEQGVEFVIRCMKMMQGGEIFVPKVPSMKIVDLAKIIAPKCEIKYIGIRPGERIHECLLTEDEARHAVEYNNFFVIMPDHPWWSCENYKDGNKLPQGFRYTSDSNEHWLTGKELQKMLKELE